MEAETNNYSFLVDKRTYYLNQIKYFEMKTPHESDVDDKYKEIEQKSKEETLIFLKKEIEALDYLIKEIEDKYEHYYFD